MTTEFTQLNNLSHLALPRNLDEIWLRYPTGSSPINASRNKYSNVIAAETSRVKLDPPVDGSDYINANYIWNREYIATQLPGIDQDSAKPFWQMVIQERVEVIISLTISPPYWPADQLEVSNGKIVRELDLDTELELGIYRRRFKIESTDGMRWNLTHLSYLSWPDSGLPASADDLLKMMKYTSEIRTTTSPIVVHCSAGIGRTGTYIAIDIGIKYKWKDVLNLLCKLREDRHGMIQTLAQYKFIREVLHAAYDKIDKK